MELPKNAISWFEIPVSNFDRAKKFYSAIYNYEMPEMQMKDRMGILLYNNQEGIGGAIVETGNHTPSTNGHRLYLNAGEDLNEILNRVEKAGGKIVAQKMPVAPDMGFIGGFEDTEGNILYVHSPR